MSQFRLSKSKILEGLQCPKRLWLTYHKPELAEHSQQTEDVIQSGLEVQNVFRGLYPDGVLIDYDDGLSKALAETNRHLADGAQRVFEATFSFDGILIRADLLEKNGAALRVYEAKSSTGVKDHYLQDSAIQYWVMTGNKLPIEAFHVSHINNQFVYRGNSNYQGLFIHEDVTALILPLVEEVPTWIKTCRETLAGLEPQIAPGGHCGVPWACAFCHYCSPPSDAAVDAYSVETLTNHGSLKKELLDGGYTSLTDVPFDRLRGDKNIRIWQAAQAKAPQVNPELSVFLKNLAFPRYYLDFETITFPVPIWEGTRPYQKLPFQYSCHIERDGGKVDHREFLDISGQAPMRKFAEQMTIDLGNSGPILTYGHFEAMIIRELIGLYPDLEPALQALINRIVDLLPLLREYYYHPEMRGSWSIKAVLPTIAPDLSYDTLEDVNNGGDIQAVFLEAIHSGTTSERREALRKNLLIYCGIDTLGMVRIAQHFS